MKNVDVVIPIYNAYDYTKICIKTVIENTNLKENYLILINDKSTDEKIKPLLDDVKNKNPKLNIVVIENEENCGFIKTVNIGMSFSENDVILLNSDTEVTENWLNKLRNAAYTENNIATVTPLSNNATLASIPNFLEENEIPKYITLNEYAKDIEECSFSDFPEITTAHGFCMYIKREAINKVGFFDAETFGKGYGEENDFSYRCIQNGYKNVLCDNTFVYHKGTQSFSENQKALVENNIKILQERYVENWNKNTELCINNPYSYIQNNIKYYVGNKHRKNILIIAHEFLKKEYKLVGGTVLHIYDVIEKLRDKFNFHVFYYQDRTYRIRSFFETSMSEIILDEEYNYEEVNIYNEKYKKLIEKVFSIINVDFIHIHHMMNHYFDLFDIIKKREIPYIINIHDFYFVCPNYNLLENGEKFCTDNPKCDCKSCLKKTRNIDGDFIKQWRKICYNILLEANEIIVPSNSTKEILEYYYKDLNIKVIEHGFDIIKQNINVDECKEDESNNQERRMINIAFLGAINQVKGIKFLEKFIDKVNKEDSNYKLHLFGTTTMYEGKLNKSIGNYIYHGKYNREDVSKLLNENNIDLMLLLSTWPETYSYVLTEVAIAGIPVLSLDYGALSERIQKNNLGWILEKNTTFEELTKKIDQIFENKNEYLEKKESIRKYIENIKSVDEMAEEYNEIYQKYLLNSCKKNENEIDKEYFKYLLKFTPRIIKNEEKIISLSNSIEEYHKTVIEYRKEIERLNEVVEKLQHTEEKYNHLTSSRKLNLLKKIGFIEF